MGRNVKGGENKQRKCSPTTARSCRSTPSAASPGPSPRAETVNQKSRQDTRGEDLERGIGKLPERVDRHRPHHQDRKPTPINNTHTTRIAQVDTSLIGESQKILAGHYYGHDKGEEKPPAGGWGCDRDPRRDPANVVILSD